VLQVEVSLEFGALLHLWLGERRVLAQVLLVQSLLKGHVGGLWHNALLFQDGEDTHLLLDQVDGRLQIRTERLRLPLNTLLHVLGLLQDEHKIVKELLQSLVGEVNTDLLEAVVLEGLEASDIQDSDEVGSLQLLDIQGLVGNIDQPGEGTGEGSLRQGTD